MTKFLKGKQVGGQDVFGYLDPAKGWGGFGFYFLESRATAYAKHPDDKAWLFDVDTMKPRVNNPAFVRAIQDVIDALPSEPADQINADPDTTAFQQFLAGTGSMLAWWGDVGSMARTSDSSVVGDIVGFAILPGSDDVYNAKTGAWDKLASGPNFAPNMAYIGWGVYVMARVDSDEKKQKAAWSAAAHLGGKDISLWMSAYPSGFQPYRNSHFNIPEWVGGRLRRGLHHVLSRLEPGQLQPSERGDRAAHPRHLPVLQRRRGRAGEDLRRPERSRRPAPTTSRRPGRSSPTRSAARSRSSSTRRRSACSCEPALDERIMIGWWRVLRAASRSFRRVDASLNASGADDGWKPRYRWPARADSRSRRTALTPAAGAPGAWLIVHRHVCASWRSPSVQAFYAAGVDQHRFRELAAGALRLRCCGRSRSAPVWC